ncbi:hypothetical protein REPUB_Repub06bG0056200 [Reevesia pubescens]
MDPRDAFVEAFLRLVEVGLAMERDKTRLMQKSLSVYRAALEAKKREHSMILRENDQILAKKKAEEKLVADFLEADGKKNFDDQKAMMDAIVALMTSGGGDHSKAEDLAAVAEGIIINYLENTRNLDINDGVVMANISGTNGGGK